MHNYRNALPCHAMPCYEFAVLCKSRHSHARSWPSTNYANCRREEASSLACAGSPAPHLLAMLLDCGTCIHTYTMAMCVYGVLVVLDPVFPFHNTAAGVDWFDWFGLRRHACGMHHSEHNRKERAARQRACPACLRCASVLLGLRP